MITYIYADMTNGCKVISEGEIDIQVDECNDMNDVREYLKDMGDQDGETFERVLSIPTELLEQIENEYGIK
jgi:hypothetical protein